MDLAQESFIELAPFGSQELPVDHVLHPSQNRAGLAGMQHGQGTKDEQQNRYKIETKKEKDFLRP